ncbi:MAG: penicillin acylase family protein, partial [Gemmatimonadetes bacterium]|nr:penicillin acylase family protein [Gemmatimonadota bacterium]
MRILRPVLACLSLAAAIYLSARPVGRLPPLGWFLDPAHGVWAVARRAELPRRESANIPGMAGPVEVVFDDRSVPHIFAGTEDDAYRALGYVVARDRLFQLELQTRATAGRLTELLGPIVLDADREQRRLDLAASADRAFEKLAAGSPAAKAIAAYAQGVNAWIERLSPSDLPLEYRLLNAKPMRWEPRYSFYLMRRMGYTLAFQQAELRRRSVASVVGEQAAAALFPANSPIQEPIQPGAGAYPRYDWEKLPPPRVGGSARRRVGGRTMEPSDSSAGARRDGVLGSNNWAVAPSRSATGHALLAGDPHLDLTLPSIWYEAHLVVRPAVAERPADPSTRRPASLDVYGVTIPGAPGVVIGFNRDVAWSLTNTDADVLDYYAETLDDRQRPRAYRLDGAWVPLEKGIETFRGQKGELLATDTIYFTHRGPVRDPHGSPLSMRWSVLETNGELEALLAGQKATSVADWLARSREFKAPAQNGVVADRAGTIAIRSTGRFPVRPGSGNGLEIRDGTTRDSDWWGDWPLERYPHATNPPRGYLSSANQQPLDPRSNGTYLGSDWPAPWRAIRINSLLRADSALTVEGMRRMQTDVGSARAEFFVPYFQEAVAVGGSAGRRVGGSDRLN